MRLGTYFSIDRALAELRPLSAAKQKWHDTAHNIQDTPSKRYYPGPTVWSHSSQYGVPISAYLSHLYLLVRLKR